MPNVDADTSEVCRRCDVQESSHRNEAGNTSSIPCHHLLSCDFARVGLLIIGIHTGLMLWWRMQAVHKQNCGVLQGI